MLRSIRRVILMAILVATPFVVVQAQPASAVWCGPDESSCDCSVYVLKKKVIPCNN